MTDLSDVFFVVSSFPSQCFDPFVVDPTRMMFQCQCCSMRKWTEPSGQVPKLGNRLCSRHGFGLLLLGCVYVLAFSRGVASLGRLPRFLFLALPIAVTSTKSKDRMSRILVDFSFVSPPASAALFTFHPALLAIATSVTALRILFSRLIPHRNIKRSIQKSCSSCEK